MQVLTKNMGRRYATIKKWSDLRFPLELVSLCFFHFSVTWIERPVGYTVSSLDGEFLQRSSQASQSVCAGCANSRGLWGGRGTKKLDPKWVPERAKHSGRKIWHEMKGPWRLSPIEHNPKITNLFSRRAFLVTPRWWRSTWRFPITDHSWNVDIHARKSKRGRRANQVKSNNSRQISQVK